MNDNTYYIPHLSALVQDADTHYPIELVLSVEDGKFTMGIDYKPTTGLFDPEPDTLTACIQMPVTNIANVIEALQGVLEAYKADNTVTINHTQNL